MPPRFEASVTVPGGAFEKVTVSPAPTVADVGEGPVGVRVTVTLAAPATPAMAREARPTTVRRVRLLVRCISILGPLRRAASHRQDARYERRGDPLLSYAGLAGGRKGGPKQPASAPTASIGGR